MYPSLGCLKNHVRVHRSMHPSHMYRALEKRFFTHSLQVVIAGGLGVPQSLREIPESYYLIRSVPLAILLEYDFLKAFVDQGKLTVISAYGSTRENSMAITPDGTLNLSVSLELYHRLGLEAVRTDQLVRKRGFDPILKKLEFGLKDSLFYPGRKIYDRLVAAAKRCELTYDILLNWRPDEAGVSPESPVAYLKTHLPELEYTLCNCRFNFQQLFDVPVPSVRDIELFDWIGTMAAGGNMRVDGDLRSPRVAVAQWTGLITQSAIFNMISAIMELLGPTPFIALSSVGFASDPTLRQPNAAFNMDSTLSVCLEAASVFTLFESPPL